MNDNKTTLQRHLSGADLSGADLSGADLTRTVLGNPMRILEACWSELSDELTVHLMRLNASGHPEGNEAFRVWAEGGPCPYGQGTVSRIASFKEKRELWSPGSFPPIWELVKAVLQEKTVSVF